MSLPKLTPIIHEWISEFLKNKKKLAELVDKHHSPINVHNPQPFKENFEEFSQVFKKYNIKHKIYFARKANKSRSMVKEAKKLGFGVDTASYRELEQCIHEGLDPENIAITAAVKNRRLIDLAIQNQVPIVLDNLDECELANATAIQLGKKINIGIRLGGFEHEGEILYTRFGFTFSQAFHLIKEGFKDQFQNLNFTGFHFHLNGYSPEQRANALFQTLNMVDLLAEKEIKTQFIDIGGGFLMNYLHDKNEWEDFHQSLKNAVLGKRSPITFANDPLGMALVDGKLHGEPKVYPYYNTTPRAVFLEQILTFENAEGIALYEVLNKHAEIEIRIEPGRSLLDQVGITVARVAFRKQDMNGDWLVGLEMNRTQMFSSSADFLLDPIIISMETKQTQQPVEGFLVGAYCLEQELILKRKLAFENLPEIGDLICFPNTAGYMMHFYESEAHLFELATNLVATKDNGEFKVARDEEY
ncbi:Y4yA family PLP-dependent enzyme [Litoribacter alkaliphilus]|uniref:Y4yA family PLP-dependent enzyme n=1 Tax=Litoribacter ruber TaxID=702568 RepID=A0AAP2CF23_9BACT|nr:Y4yA family PLP-dependent enzyme [Litoribacter alkaliphilus]MBS9523381.1 Y4yA family PLP-dependent enzyme [Litoribacter alkaliphilus]